MTRWCRTSAILGGITWLVVLVVPLPDALETVTVERLLLLAILVFSPLCLSLIALPDRAGHDPRSYRVVVWGQPFAAALAVIAVLLPVGRAAALLAGTWELFTVFVGLLGLVRLLPRGFICADETCIDVALLYLPIGGIWFLFARLGVRPLGFSEIIVLLTAVHFHYAGFAAPIITGMAGRELAEVKPSAWRIYRLVALGVILGTPLVAVGIALSPLIEVVAVVALATSLFGLSLLALFFVVPRVAQRAAKGLLIVSSAAVPVTMVFAVGYGIGKFVGSPILSIPQMIRFHGLVNGIGFVLCGLVAWNLAHPRSRLNAPGIPFSTLQGRGRIGPDFFQHIHAVGDAGKSTCGLVDDLNEFRRADFDPDNVHPEIRCFYEKTERFDLLVYPDWRLGFRWAARIYKLWGSRIEQMNFPLADEQLEDQIESQIIPIDDRMDGRTNVRAWIRTYTKTGKAVYVAAYATHTMNDDTYMNIAFPLPNGNLTSILHIAPMQSDERSAGVLLTTFHTRRRAGDEGVYFANRLLPVRLPINETIRVWAVGMQGVPDTLALKAGRLSKATVVASHDMWLFGIKYLTLNYLIFPRPVQTIEFDRVDSSVSPSPN